MAGRKTKRTPEAQEVLIEVLREGNTRRTACACAGISEDTFARWLADDADFAGAIKKAEAEALARNIAVIQKAGADGNWQASAWWAERKFPDEWGRRETLSILQKTVRELDALSDEELLRIAIGSEEDSAPASGASPAHGTRSRNGNGKH